MLVHPRPGLSSRNLSLKLSLVGFCHGLTGPIMSWSIPLDLDRVSRDGVSDEPQHGARLEPQHAPDRQIDRKQYG